MRPMNQTSAPVSRTPRSGGGAPLVLAWLMICLVWATVWVIALPAPRAHADQRPTDIVCGSTVQTRKLTGTDAPDINAQEAMVVGQNGTVYFERDADKEVKIASITKVMTAIVALENAQLTDTVTVDKESAEVYGSTAGLKEGDTMPLETAMSALMVPSGNDAAMAIAKTVGAKFNPGNPMQGFVDKMNAKAKELGMTRTVFTNPHGLDDEQWAGNLHSTARDVITMFTHAMKNEQFRKIINQNDATIVVKGADGKDRPLALKGHNLLLGQLGNIGGKTGTTPAAGSCYVSAFKQKDGGEIYTVVLGSSAGGQRYTDTKALGTWYYHHWVAYPLANSGTKTAEGVGIVARVTNRAWSDKTVAVTTKQKTVGLFSLLGKVSEDVQLTGAAGAVSEGQTMGTLTLTQAGKQVASVELVAAENQAAPGPIEFCLVQFDRLVRLISGQPTSAPTKLLNKTPDPMTIDKAA